MGIVKAFENAYEKKEKRGWEHIYVFVDIHDTIFKATYNEKETFKYYKDAKNALKMMSKQKDIILGLSTCSYPAEIGKYLDKLADDGIEFTLVNDNPMEKNTNYACFDHKPYFNVLIEDKAGFDPDVEWYRIFKHFQRKALIKMMRLDEELGLYDDSDNKICDCNSNGRTTWQLTSDGLCMRCGNKYKE